MEPFNFVISLGYRCATTHILNELQLKTFSCPFDWSICTLKTVCTCLEDDFGTYLDINNYASKRCTFNNPTPEGGTKTILHHDNVYVNTKLNPPEQWEDSQNNELCFLHHDLSKPNIHNALIRKVDRFQKCLSSGRNILFVWISRLSRHTDTAEAMELVEKLQQKGIKAHLLFISMLLFKEDRAKSSLMSYKHMDILQINCNPDFVDNDLPFQGNHTEEISIIKDMLRKYSLDLIKSPT